MSTESAQQSNTSHSAMSLVTGRPKSHKRKVNVIDILPLPTVRTTSSSGLTFLKVPRQILGRFHILGRS